MKTRKPLMTAFLLIGFLAGWLALVFQLYLTLSIRVLSVTATVLQYLSYFTILTNLLVALCFSFLLLKPDSRWGIFFSKPGTLAALAVYITVVGAIYNIILRALWSPQGLQFIVNELLHSFIPAFFLVFWFVFTPKNDLQWKDVLPWLWYPLIYLVYTLVRGPIADWYPYPFLDVTALGYETALINGAGIAVVFVFFSLLFIALAKWMTRLESSRSLSD
jgi:hypothetical protein